MAYRYNSILPTQSGNSGKVLSTDGNNPLWTDSAGGGINSITVDAPLNSTGGTDPEIGLNDSAVDAGDYIQANITVDEFGIIQAASYGGLDVTPVKTANYNAQSNDVVQCGDGTYNVVLPLANSASKNRMIIVWGASERTGTVTILPTGGDLINGGASESLTSGSFSFISNGAGNWLEI